MKNVTDKALATFDQFLYSATAPMYILFSYFLLPINEFALSVQVIFLYGCLASILQSLLAEPYLIGNKLVGGQKSPQVYYSGAILGAFGCACLSFPVLLFITNSFQLSLLLCLLFTGLLLQDQLRYLRIQESRLIRLIFSDGYWIVMLITLIYLFQSDGYPILLLTWAISGFISLFAIVDLKVVKSVSIISGLKLLLHNCKNYSFMFGETLVSAFLQILCNLFIAKFLGDEAISLFRLLALIFGVSTVIINRQRTFDFAQENAFDGKRPSIQRMFRRFRELCFVVAFNFVIVSLLLVSADKLISFEFIILPSFFLLIAGGLERLAVGSLISVTVFLKSHDGAQRIALIRTGTVLVSTLFFGILSFEGVDLTLILIINALIYFLVSTALGFKIVKS